MSHQIKAFILRLLAPFFIGEKILHVLEKLAIKETLYEITSVKNAGQILYFLHKSTFLLHNIT